MFKMVGVILAAGNGKRLAAELGFEQCKSLLSLDGKRLIDYSLENLAAFGVDSIYVVVGKYAEEIMRAVGESYKDIPISYLIQKKPIGIINALSVSLPHIKDDFVIQLSDEVFLNNRSEELKNEWKNRKNDFFCGIVKEENAARIKENYSVCVNGEMQLLSCTEKPAEVENLYKGTGYCVFSRECIALCRKNYGTQLSEDANLCDYMNLLIKNGMTGRCINVAQKEINVNTIFDFEYARKTVKEL